MLCPGGSPIMSYVGMYGSEGYAFSVVLVIDRVSILAILVINRARYDFFWHSSRTW